MNSATARTITFALVGLFLALAIIGGVTGIERYIPPRNTTSNSVGNSSTSLHMSTKSGPPSPSTTSQVSSFFSGGSLGVEVVDPPHVPNGVTSVIVTLSEVDVHSSGTASGWHDVANESEVDLLSVVKKSVSLGSSHVSPSAFDSVRFDILSVVVTYNGQNYNANVSQDRFVIPIGTAGVVVEPNGSSGILIDISTTIAASLSNGGTAFTLFPKVVSLPVPSQYWTPSMENSGSEDSSEWWASSIPSN